MDPLQWGKLTLDAKSKQLVEVVKWSDDRSCHHIYLQIILIRYNVRSVIYEVDYYVPVNELQISYFLRLTLGLKNPIGLIGVTRPTLYIFINFSNNKKRCFFHFLSLLRMFAPVDIIIGAYGIFNHFQTYNHKSVLKNKWLSSFQNKNKKVFFTFLCIFYNWIEWVIQL